MPKFKEYNLKLLTYNFINFFHFLYNVHMQKYFQQWQMGLPDGIYPFHPWRQ